VIKILSEEKNITTILAEGVKEIPNIAGKTDKLIKSFVQQGKISLNFQIDQSQYECDFLEVTNNTLGTIDIFIPNCSEKLNVIDEDSQDEQLKHVTTQQTQSTQQPSKKDDSYKSNLWTNVSTNKLQGERKSFLHRVQDRQQSPTSKQSEILTWDKEENLESKRKFCERNARKDITIGEKRSSGEISLTNSRSSSPSKPIVKKQWDYFDSPCDDSDQRKSQVFFLKQK